MEIEQKFFVTDSFSIPADWHLESESFQLNHYFGSEKDPCSIRTRFDSSTGFEIVTKWTTDGGDAHNGNARHEMSIPVEQRKFEYFQWAEGYVKDPDKLLHMVNNLLETYVDYRVLASGIEYLSKWSRRCKIYDTNGVYTVRDEINSGYGRIVEIELKPGLRVCETLDDELKTLIDYGKSLGLIPLEKDLLKKMYSFYNGTWQDFYLTNKTIFEDPRFHYAK